MRRARTLTPSTSILAEDGDVSFHEAPDDIAAQVEAIDVRAGIYRAWLADGRIIALDAPQKWGPVAAHITPDSDVDGLRATLLNCGRALGLTATDLATHPLHELVERVMAADADWRLRSRGPVRKLLERLLPWIFSC